MVVSSGRRPSTGLIGQANRAYARDADHLAPPGHDPSRRLTQAYDRRLGVLDHDPNRRSTLADIVVRDAEQLFRTQVEKDWEERAQLRRNSEAQSTLSLATAADRRPSIASLAIAAVHGAVSSSSGSAAAVGGQSRRPSNIQRKELPLLVIESPEMEITQVSQKTQSIESKDSIAVTERREYAAPVALPKDFASSTILCINNEGSVLFFSRP